MVHQLQDRRLIGEVIEETFRSPAKRGLDFNPLSNRWSALTKLRQVENEKTGCVCEGEKPCETTKRGCPAGNPIQKLNKALEIIIPARKSADKYTREADECTQTGRDAEASIAKANANIFEIQARNATVDIYTLWRQTMAFPGLTGRICPGPCQSACILSIQTEQGGVQIRNSELILHHLAIEYGLHKAYVPDQASKLTGKKVAIIGSGPAGIATAKALAQVCDVVVFEKREHLGGLLATGIPAMKLEPEMVKDELSILRKEGVTFHTNQNIDAERLKGMLNEYDAVVMAIGSEQPRLLSTRDCPGADAKGVIYWDKFLENQKDLDFALHLYREDLNVKGQDVVVYGYGATAEDVIATCVRQGAKSITVIYRGINDEAEPGMDTWDFRRENSLGWHGRYGTEEATAANLKHRLNFRVLTESRLHEILTDEFGNVRGILFGQVYDKSLQELIPGTEEINSAARVIVAIGPKGPLGNWALPLGVKVDSDGAIVTNRETYETEGCRNLYVAGDCRSVPEDLLDDSDAQKLVVRALAEGMNVGVQIFRKLSGKSNATSADLMPDFSGI